MSFGVKVEMKHGEAYCQCKFPLPMKKEIGVRIGHIQDYQYYRCGWCGSISEAVPIEYS